MWDMHRPRNNFRDGFTSCKSSMCQFIFRPKKDFINEAL